MEVTIFIYNIFLIILCSIVLTLSGFYYLKTKNKCYFGIIVLFSLYLFNNIVVYTTEFIKTFSLSYNNLFISIPTYKTLILISILAAYIMINNIFLNLKNPKIWYFALAFLTIFLLIILVMERTAFKVWLFFLPGDIFFIVFNIYILNILRNKELTKGNELLRCYKKILKYFLLMSCLVLIEDIFVIFKIDIYTDTILHITNRNFSEDILRISQSIMIVYYFFNYYPFESNQKEERHIILSGSNYKPASKDKKNEDKYNYYIFHLFCKTYLFTIREQEVFQHLLEEKNNKVISESLYISVGTVKAHVHNIFIKAKVSNRRELAQTYNKWKENQIASI